MVHAGRAVRELWYHDLLRHGTLALGEKLAMLKEERWVIAGVHGS